MTKENATVRHDTVEVENRLESVNEPYIFRPLISAFNSWHFYCMQWSNSDGLVQTYQDAIELENQYGEIRYRAAGHVIPSNGAMVLGQELDAYASGFDPNQAFKGSLAGLNFWTYILHINTIQGMAAGMINVNGDLLQWRDFRIDHYVFGNVSIVERSEAEIPGILTISNSKESEST
jgi:hypothetical protein